MNKPNVPPSEISPIVQRLKIYKLQRLPHKLRSVTGKAYQGLLDRTVIHLFLSPAKAICSASQLTLASPERVISNYCQGLVLFGRANDKLVWESFPARAIITPEAAHIPKRLKGTLRNHSFEIRYNTDLEGVIRACQREKTWINEPLIQIYQELFEQGVVETIELYQDGELVGGIWGTVIQGSFGIMSMFHRANHAGAIALGTLVTHLKDSKYRLVDCGELNDNFARYGAVSIPYEEFINQIARAHFQPRSTQIKA
jgi:leucyl/phenylalanyl-tRNA---protein transferase